MQTLGLGLDGAHARIQMGWGLQEKNAFYLYVAESIEISREETRRRQESSQIIRGSTSVKSREPETSETFHFEDFPGDIPSNQSLSVCNGRAGNLDYLFLQMDRELRAIGLGRS